MKKCPKCNDMAIYDDTVDRCPICNSVLTTFSAGSRAGSQDFSRLPDGAGVPNSRWTAAPIPSESTHRRTRPQPAPVPRDQSSRPGEGGGGPAPQTVTRQVVAPVPEQTDSDFVIADPAPHHDYNDRTDRRRTARPTERRDAGPPQFERLIGRVYVYRGRVAEVNSHSRYYNRFHKVINSAFRGEPYQFGHSSYETVIRVEEFTDARLPTQSRDLVMYGDIEAAVHVGDDVEIHAVRRGGRYVIQTLHNNQTESDVTPGPQMSMLVCILLAAAGIALISGILYGIYAFFAKGGFEALVMALVNLVMSIIFKLLPLIVLIAFVLAILSLLTGNGRRR